MAMGKKLISRVLTEQVVTRVADESIVGIKEVVGKLAGNYVKRRNVGFGVIDSAAGSYRETKRYYNDILIGKEPTVMQEAVTFNDDWQITNF